MGAPKPWRSAGRWMTPAWPSRLDRLPWRFSGHAGSGGAGQQTMSVVSRARSYDYIILGAGSSGCALAHRLAEDDGVRLLLLEAGGWDRDPWLKIPLAWGRILQRRMYDWMYFAEPEASMSGRGIECARGKVIGGSSSTNALD